MLLTATCGAAKYGRLTTDAKVVSAFKLIDWTITTERVFLISLVFSLWLVV